MSVRLFVGNLNESIDEKELRAVFGLIAGVVDSQVMRDRVTRHSRSFGFVEVMTGEDADRAIEELSGTPLRGKVIRVERANPRAEGRRSGRQRERKHAQMGR